MLHYCLVLVCVCTSFNMMKRETVKLMHNRLKTKQNSMSHHVLLHFMLDFGIAKCICAIEKALFPQADLCKRP